MADTLPMTDRVTTDRATTNSAAFRADPLPAPVSGQHHEIGGGPAGRLAYFSAGEGGDRPPLLLIHSVNAAASAYEIMPLYEHYRSTRRVYALELPGFGHSERSDRTYSVRIMTDAILAATREIQKDHPAPIDALALSLSCEFLARAVSEMPLAFRTAGLISPTGFDAASKARGSKPGTRAIPWLRSILDAPVWSRGLFTLLTSRPSIRFFLKKTFGSDRIDEGLLDYDYISAHQPGARHAPYYFVSGYLFSRDIMDVYRALTLPVWMAHGVRGDFQDYSGKGEIADRKNWTITVFQTGTLPHFEDRAAVTQAYDAFLEGMAN